MPTTKIANSYVDQRLTNVARIDFLNTGFIHDKILPSISNLKKKTGKIGKMGLEHMRFFGTTQRDSYDESPHRVDFKYLTDSEYKIVSHDVEVFLPIDLITQADAPFNARNDARMFLEGIRNIAMEKPLADNLGDPTVITNNSTPSVLWDVPATSDPLGNLSTAAEDVRSRKGVDPNRMIIQASVVASLQNHPQFKDKLQGVNKIATLSKKDVLKIIANHLDIEVKNIYVGMAKYISTAPGQSETKTDIWNKDVVLYWVPERATLWTPSLGYRLSRGGVAGSKVVKRRPHPDDADYGEIVKMMWEYQDLLLDVDSAYLLDGVIS